jgi:hypothetical protein
MWHTDIADCGLPTAREVEVFETPLSFLLSVVLFLFLLGVFKKRSLRNMSGPKRDEITGSGEDYITRNFMICTPHKIFG